LKTARPELSVWIVTGDGDALSIGGNHTIHLLRRNLNVNVLLFNNQIYGLTKGQYSPTSEQGKITKSTPSGSPDHPFNPLALALGADATFVARSIDRDPKHLQAMLLRSAQHKGTSFLEIYQNCNVFNDGAFFPFTEKESKADTTLVLEQGQPLVFANGRKGIRLDGLKPEIVEVAETGTDGLWVHNEHDLQKANLLVRFFDMPTHAENPAIFPRPVGVLYANTTKDCYEDVVQAQIDLAIAKRGKGNLNKLLAGAETWVIEET
jgi:2-oxoglutarate ferredoxin oxidoreductase subunit beta